jgi:hypothetical protein
MAERLEVECGSLHYLRTRSSKSQYMQITYVQGDIYNFSSNFSRKKRVFYLDVRFLSLRLAVSFST